ncbi:prephenate dehydrogenase [Neisseria animalis]|uniref:prephenate dehydrogenase n=1 Tax=Neisseria animalis TaxID=492 RepID=A0A5P3MPU7_NEIAN|nr:prephenate dehydrogenase/arogenate dehydrogenase family protein [Neisseria animalis]QEY23576.1 prephenate dehydrogenase/arogenate dehydrogenase family protein [Neisseria animalis]ROW32721.1 prephenate dehydrogenase/arogenate dehydrogenase family protein [Neisseria animalis]VEE09255.1 oxidoreductase [Neisseria animalis]
MSVSLPLKHITLIGVGLIGGSFVLDLKRLGLVERVAGVDLSRDNLERALERKVIDEAFTEISEASIGNADLVLIATPVSTLPQICRAIKPFLRQDTLVSDVGSTKQSALAAFESYLPEFLPNCIATHPIAGSDRHGALAAQFGLYQDKKLIITPHGREQAGGIERVEALWQAVGAKTFRMSAAEHDAIFAAVSHLPHLLAFAFVHEMFDHPDGQRFLQFAASGFRDFTRIASSHPAIWTDICMANKNSLLGLLSGVEAQLAVLRDMLEKGDTAALYRYFEEAKNTRDEWLKGQ